MKNKKLSLRKKDVTKLTNLNEGALTPVAGGLTIGGSWGSGVTAPSASFNSGSGSGSGSGISASFNSGSFSSVSFGSLPFTSRPMQN